MNMRLACGSLGITLLLTLPLTPRQKMPGETTSTDRPKHTKISMQNLPKLPATNFVTGTTTDN
jgi:hypothetical protein